MYVSQRLLIKQKGVFLLFQQPQQREIESNQVTLLELNLYHRHIMLKLKADLLNSFEPGTLVF